MKAIWSATDRGYIDEIISALKVLGKEKMICYADEINWLKQLRKRTEEDYKQQVRIQFFGQIASAIMSNYEFYAHAIGEECKKSGKSRPEMVAQMSLEIADALVAELKKGGQDDGI